MSWKQMENGFKNREVINCGNAADRSCEMRNDHQTNNVETDGHKV